RDADRLTAIDPRWTAIAGQLTGARDTVDDLVRSLTEYRQSLEFDPARADQIEARQAELFRLKQKYGGSCAAIHERLRELEAEQNSAGDREQRAARLTREDGEREKSLAAAARQLSAARQSTAVRLAKAVNGALAGLGMSGARVRVDVVARTDGGITVGSDDGPIHVHESGADEVQFTFEANPKEGFKPLHKIASGGELSRLLLAFKNAMPARGQSRLYIFDEVDSGIGGRTAALVAERIAELARGSQVFLISHLQQMAAPADQHCLIEKRTVRQRARVTLRNLTGDERVQELARMVAGDEVTERTLEFASELAGGRSARGQ
ncbi:MAG TPA: DNA repair protein RecN, partial [Acidobacteriota bacterium]|nr:DNA repair protein RecN [Acidobacteriota bacterium]